MLRIILVIAILAGAGGLYLSLVPVKEKIATITAARDEFQEGKTKAESDASKSKRDLLTVRTALEQANNDLAQKATDLDDANRSLAAQRQRANLATEESNRRQAELLTTQQELTRFRAIGLGVPEILNLRAKEKAAADARDTFRAENEMLSKSLAVVQKKLDDILKGVERDVELPLGLKGKVTAVDERFGFVVLNIGSADGVLERGKLLLHRDGKLIGRVQVTSVEPNRSIANVITEWNVGSAMEDDQVLY